MPDFVGIDYGVRRIAWAIISTPTPEYPLTWKLTNTDELVLPKAKNGCFLCPVNDMLDYVDSELVPLLKRTTSVTVESPITGASLNRLTASQMAIVAGGIFARVSRVTQNHYMVAPSSWKKVAVGNGSATKEDVMAHMVEWWRFTPSSQDVADSMGIAMWTVMNGVDDGS